VKHILSLNEYRNQLEIPFMGKHPLHDKPTHVHLLDRLEEMSTELKINPDHYTSDWGVNDIQNAWNNNLEEAYKIYVAHDTEMSYDENYEFNSMFLNQYDIIEHQQYFNQEIKDYIDENEDCTSDDIIDNFNLYYHLSEFLSGHEDLIKINKVVQKEVFDYKLDENDVAWIIQNKRNKDGLIPIYRAVSYDKGDLVDTYTKLKEYNGVGIYWSYDESGAEPHGGSGRNCYVLYGLVKPEYINWESTIYKSAWHLSDEKEIEIESEIPVMIYKITKYNSKSIIELKKPLIVNS
jgi:hypothetical protein